MKFYLLIASALAVISGLLAFDATQATVTPGAQASSPAASRPAPAHQATEAVFPGFNGHYIFGYYLL